jgi:uncharacterized membrane protein
MCVGYIKFAVILFVIDMIWIRGFTSLHKEQLEKVQKSPLQIDMKAGTLFYVLAAIAYFEVIKKLAINKEDAFKKGALLGLLMYGTFDITNKTIFKDYTWDYAIKDTLWGTFAMGAASYIAYSFNI